MTTVGKIREMCRLLVEFDPAYLAYAVKISWPFAHMGNDAVVALDSCFFETALSIMGMR